MLKFSIVQRQPLVSPQTKLSHNVPFPQRIFFTENNEVKGDIVLPEKAPTPCIVFPLCWYRSQMPWTAQYRMRDLKAPNGARYSSEMQVRFRNTSIPLHVLLNYSILFLLCCLNLGITIMNVAEQLSPLLIHIPTPKEIGCNGHLEFCDRSYSNITQIATHDSAFVGILPMDNQNVLVSKQLDAGIRFLQAQTHLDASKTLSLCHTDCGMKDAGSLHNYLGTVRAWLDAHPKEVVTLLLTNGDFANITSFAHAFNISGIVPYAYTPLPTHSHTDPTTWPTLAQLITNNTRLIIFLDTGADVPTVPYILPEFTYFWETPFDTIDPSFSQCAIDRPEDISNNPEKVKERMYIVNHFLDTSVVGMEVPDRRDAGRTNMKEGKGSVGEQVGRCMEMHEGRKPKAVLVDYFEKGQVFEVQDELNGV